MIKINLLPQELKAKNKKVSIDPGYFLYLIPLIFAVLVCVHIYLAVFNATKIYQFRLLNNKWQKLQPQREILEDFKRKYEVLSADANLIQKLTEQRILWSKKLNKLSLNLPSGIWFNEITLSAEDFILRGTVVSLQKEELNLINKFIDNLKNDAGFFKDFNKLELSSVQRRVVGGYDIIDFILIGTLK